jgi:uncharacterized membrane protein
VTVSSPSHKIASVFEKAFWDATVLAVHVLAATLFIGPQVFLAAIAIPAVRTIDDLAVRQRVTRAIAAGFGVLGGVSLVVLLISGIYNYYQNDQFMNSDFPRYFSLMQLKLTLVTLVIILTALHGAVFGRRVQRLQEAGAGEAEVASARRWSMMTSMANLAVSLVILVCGVLISSDWSKLD